MAFFENNINDKRILLLMIIGIPLIASTNIDCSGKSFHCLNSTHFMICVDLGGGVSYTVDDFVIPCPPSTVCKRSNNFECELPPSTTAAPTTTRPATLASTQLNEKESTTEDVIEDTMLLNAEPEQHLELSTLTIPETSTDGRDFSLQPNINKNKSETNVNTTDTPVVRTNGPVQETKVLKTVIGNDKVPVTRLDTTTEFVKTSDIVSVNAAITTVFPTKILPRTTTQQKPNEIELINEGVIIDKDLSTTELEQHLELSTVKLQETSTESAVTTSEPELYSIREVNETNLIDITIIATAGTMQATTAPIEAIGNTVMPALFDNTTLVAFSNVTTSDILNMNVRDILVESTTAIPKMDLPTNSTAQQNETEDTTVSEVNETNLNEIESTIITTAGMMQATTAPTKAMGNTEIPALFENSTLFDLRNVTTSDVLDTNPRDILVESTTAIPKMDLPTNSTTQQNENEATTVGEVNETNQNEIEITIIENTTLDDLRNVATSEILETNDRDILVESTTAIPKMDLPTNSAAQQNEIETTTDGEVKETNLNKIESTTITTARTMQETTAPIQSMGNTAIPTSFNNTTLVDLRNATTFDIHETNARDILLVESTTVIPNPDLQTNSTAQQNENEATTEDAAITKIRSWDTNSNQLINLKNVTTYDILDTNATDDILVQSTTATPKMDPPTNSTAQQNNTKATTEDPAITITSLDTNLNQYSELSTVQETWTDSTVVPSTVTEVSETKLNKIESILITTALVMEVTKSPIQTMENHTGNVAFFDNTTLVDSRNITSFDIFDKKSTDILDASTTEIPKIDLPTNIPEQNETEATTEDVVHTTFSLDTNSEQYLELSIVATQENSTGAEDFQLQTVNKIIKQLNNFSETSLERTENASNTPAAIIELTTVSIQTIDTVPAAEVNINNTGFVNQSDANSNVEEQQKNQAAISPAEKKSGSDIIEQHTTESSLFERTESTEPVTHNDTMNNFTDYDITTTEHDIVITTEIAPISTTVAIINKYVGKTESVIVISGNVSSDGEISTGKNQNNTTNSKSSETVPKININSNLNNHTDTDIILTNSLLNKITTINLPGMEKDNIPQTELFNAIVTESTPLITDSTNNNSTQEIISTDFEKYPESSTDSERTALGEKVKDASKTESDQSILKSVIDLNQNADSAKIYGLENKKANALTPNVDFSSDHIILSIKTTEIIAPTELNDVNRTTQNPTTNFLVIKDTSAVALNTNNQRQELDFGVSISTTTESDDAIENTVSESFQPLSESLDFSTNFDKVRLFLNNNKGEQEKIANEKVTETSLSSQIPTTSSNFNDNGNPSNSITATDTTISTEGLSNSIGFNDEKKYSTKEINLFTLHTTFMDIILNETERVTNKITFNTTVDKSLNKLDQNITNTIKLIVIPSPSSVIKNNTLNTLENHLSRPNASDAYIDESNVVNLIPNLEKKQVTSQQPRTDYSNILKNDEINIIDSGLKIEQSTTLSSQTSGVGKNTSLMNTKPRDVINTSEITIVDGKINQSEPFNQIIYNDGVQLHYDTITLQVTPLSKKIIGSVNEIITTKDPGTITTNSSKTSQKGQSPSIHKIVKINSDMIIQNAGITLDPSNPIADAFLREADKSILLPNINQNNYQQTLINVEKEQIAMDQGTTSNNDRNTQINGAENITPSEELITNTLKNSEYEPGFVIKQYVENKIIETLPKISQNININASGTKQNEAQQILAVSNKEGNGAANNLLNTNTYTHSSISKTEQNNSVNILGSDVNEKNIPDLITNKNKAISLLRGIEEEKIQSESNSGIDIEHITSAAGKSNSLKTNRDAFSASIHNTEHINSTQNKPANPTQSSSSATVILNDNGVQKKDTQSEQSFVLNVITRAINENTGSLLDQGSQSKQKGEYANINSFSISNQERAHEIQLSADGTSISKHNISVNETESKQSELHSNITPTALQNKNNQSVLQNAEDDVATIVKITNGTIIFNNHVSTKILELFNDSTFAEHKKSSTVSPKDIDLKEYKSQSISSPYERDQNFKVTKEDVAEKFMTLPSEVTIIDKTKSSLQDNVPVLNISETAYSTTPEVYVPTVKVIASPVSNEISLKSETNSIDKNIDRNIITTVSSAPPSLEIVPTEGIERINSTHLPNVKDSWNSSKATAVQGPMEYTQVDVLNSKPASEPEDLLLNDRKMYNSMTAPGISSIGTLTLLGNRQQGSQQNNEFTEKVKYSNNINKSVLTAEKQINTTVASTSVVHVDKNQTITTSSNVDKVDVTQNIPLAIKVATGMVTNTRKTTVHSTPLFNPDKTTFSASQNSTVKPLITSKKQNALVKKTFDCRTRHSGKYADNNDCSKFYICSGAGQAVMGKCPVNTVFSEIRKQCTRNLSHCIRNNEFKCSSAGRFVDYLKANVYYICIRKEQTFLRYKLQCQKGYLLNRSTVTCYKLLEPISKSKSNDVSQSTTEKVSKEKDVKKKSNQKKQVEDFECEEEGKFEDPNDCRGYYICRIKNKSDETYHQKYKKCDQDEVFHKELKKCVDASSYECRYCDSLKPDIYYVRVTRKNHSLTYKLQCQNGYYLNKTSITCVKKSNQLGPEIISRDADKFNTNKNRKSIECKEKGKFPDPNDCKRYYICKEKNASNNSEPEFKRKHQKCKNNRVYSEEKQTCIYSKNKVC